MVDNCTAPQLVDQLALMSSTLNSMDSLPKSTQRSRRPPTSSGCPNFPSCPNTSRAAVIDIVILIVVLGAFGFLLYPYAKFIAVGLVGMISVISYAVKDEICDAPLIYGSIGVSVFFASLAAWALLMCTSQNCGKKNCRGLRNAPEFDIQLETEDCVKNSSALDGSKRCLFELPSDHYRQIETKLKKMAPPNGRAVLIIQARCGCSLARLEVPGPKKPRKIKK